MCLTKSSPKYIASSHISKTEDKRKKDMDQRNSIGAKAVSCLHILVWSPLLPYVFHSTSSNQPFLLSISSLITWFITWFKESDPFLALQNNNIVIFYDILNFYGTCCNYFSIVIPYSTIRETFLFLSCESITRNK